MSDQSRFEIDCQMSAGTGVINIRSGIGDGSLRTGNVSADDVSKFLEKNRNSPLVEVRINSNGGDAEQGMAIYDALVAFPGTVVTINEGAALSAAALVFTAGKRRVMTAGSQFMIHEARLDRMSGTADRLREAIAFLESINRRVAEMMGSRAGKSSAYVLDLMKKETWFDPEKAIREGFATELSATKSKMSAGLDMTGYRNIPPAFAQFKSAVSATAEDRFSVIL